MKINEDFAQSCDFLFEYKLGSGSEVERKRFERHLAECAPCRSEAALWSETWERLHEEAPDIEPPPELKTEVMNAIFKKDGRTEQTKQTRVETRSRSRRRWPAMTAALLLTASLAFTAGRWSASEFWSRNGEQESEMAANTTPDRIEALFHLAADKNSGRFADFPRAYGVACIVQSEEGKRLVVYVFGSPGTTGKQTYHVWLRHNGQRSSAGTFRVESSGFGILTVPVSDSVQAIEAIGITLEPDSRSDVPRGPKLFGSSDEDPGWQA